MQPGQDEGRGEVEADRPHKRRHTQTNAGHPSDHHELAEKVAKTVIAQYEALPKTGKPQPHEHTVLCGFVLSRSCSASGGTSDVSELSCVAIGTGTKCLGGSQRSEAGDLVNDSHAVGSFCVCRSQRCMLHCTSHPLLALTPPRSPPGGCAATLRPIVLFPVAPDRPLVPLPLHTLCLHSSSQLDTPPVPWHSLFAFCAGAFGLFLCRSTIISASPPTPSVPPLPCTRRSSLVGRCSGGFMARQRPP